MVVSLHLYSVGFLVAETTLKMLKTTLGIQLTKQSLPNTIQNKTETQPTVLYISYPKQVMSQS